MQWSEGRLGRVFVMRMEHGDSIPKTIEEFAKARGVRQGFCVALGGLGTGTLVAGPEDGTASPIVPLLELIGDVHEAAAIGTIFPSEDGTPTLHMHGALGRRDSSRIGCLRAGVDVWKTFEVILIELVGVMMRRKMDRESGLELLSSE
jgi:predicted DNA-binding protein with PD1-like motif